jgi:hypothetical protein
MYKKFDGMMNLFYKIKDTIESIKLFFINSWRFRKELSTYCVYSYDLDFLKKSIELTRDYMVLHGNEEPISKNKKIEAMTRTIYILNVFIEDSFRELAEEELNLKCTYNFKVDKNTLIDLSTAEEKATNKLIRDKDLELRAKYWDELFVLLKGQNPKDIPKDTEWAEFFNGSGILYWWD